MSTTLKAPEADPVAERDLAVLGSLLLPTGGDDAAAFAALLPSAGGPGKAITLAPGRVYNWASTPQLPANLTSWLTIRPNGAIIRLASGVRRFFDLNGAATGSEYRWIRFEPGGTWDYNGNTAGTVNNHILLGNLIAGAAAGGSGRQYTFKHIHVRGQVGIGAPAQATPSLQWLSLWHTHPTGLSDDIVFEDNDFSGGCMGWVALSLLTGRRFGTIRTNRNRWDSGTPPSGTTPQGISHGCQVGGLASLDYWENEDNYVANSWDVGAEADNCQRASIRGNTFVDCFNSDVLIRNQGPVPNVSAQQIDVDNLHRNVNYDPSGTAGAATKVLLGSTTVTANGTGTTTSGSRTVTAATGTWAESQTIKGTGIQVGSIVNAVSGSAGNLTLTLNLTTTASASGVALSYQDFQIGQVNVAGEVDIETAMADYGARTGLVVDAHSANVKSLTVDDLAIGFGAAFAYSPAQVGSHLVLIDASPFSANAVINIGENVRAAFAGQPADAANFIEMVRCNANHAELNVSGGTLDISAIRATVNNVAFLVCALGYQNGSGYQSTSARLHGNIDGLRAYNGQVGAVLYGVFGDSGCIIPAGSAIDMHGNDFGQWSSIGGADYTAPSPGAAFIVRDYAGTRANIPAAGVAPTGIPASVPSNANIVLPLGGETVALTGSTTVTSITASRPQRRVTLLVPAAVALTDNGTTLNLAGNFTGGGAITLVCDGTNWIEAGRSVNG